MTAATVSNDVSVESLDVSAFTVPTDAPESDGTLAWDSTTMVLVQAHAGTETGLGWTYGSAAIGALIESKLAAAVRGCDAMDPQSAYAAMTRAIRNDGETGIAYMAISAVDIALWDLKARLLEISLSQLIGRYREHTPIYGSGGFTSYTDAQLRDQLSGWAAEGIPRVKMKVGREPDRDPHRVCVARDAVGDEADLFVDANGAYSRKQALDLADVFRAEARVSWFEEPVSSEDLEGLRLIRDRAPAGVQVAAGEYGYALAYFERMVSVVDVQQADMTRCGGVTGILRVDAICRSRSIPLSGHCAPTLHGHALCGCECTVHLEYFHDHARMEGMLFEGALSPDHGELRPDPSRPGLGVELKRSEAERYAL